MNPLQPAYTKQVITTTTKTEKPKLTAFQQTGKHIPDTGAILGIVFAVIALLVLIAPVSCGQEILQSKST